jgi:hypothetical protein
MIWLRLNLRKLKSESTPDKKFTIALKTELLKSVNGVKVYRTTVVFRYALAPIALALMLGVGTTSYAYASPKVCNGHLLYPIKSGVEQVEQTVFYRTPEAKVQYQVKTFERRADEVNYAIDHGVPPVIILQKVPEQFTITEQQIAQYRARREKEEEKEMKAREAMEKRAERVLQDFRKKVEASPLKDEERTQVLFLIDQRLSETR